MADRETKKAPLSAVSFEFNQLRYFVAAAEQLSFSQAAAILHVSQPLISQQIAELERQLGAELFVRSRRNVSLTPAGAIMLEEARAILARISDSTRSVQAANLGLEFSGRLSICLEQLFGHAAFTQSVFRFRTRYPAIEIRTEIRRMSDILRGLAEGTIDLGLCILPVGKLGPEFQIRELMRDKLCFVASAQLIHAKQPDCFSWLAECLPCCLLEKDFRGTNSSMKICLELGITPQFLFFPDLENVLMQVESGTGFSILPSRAVDMFPRRDLALVPLDGFPDAELTLAAIWNQREPNPIAELFLNEFICETPMDAGEEAAYGTENA